MTMFNTDEKLLYRDDQVSSKKGYYSYNDHGDVVKITDNSGSAINTYVYDVWGYLLAETEKYIIK